MQDVRYATLPRCLILGVNCSWLSVMLPSTELLSWLPSVEERCYSRLLYGGVALYAIEPYGVILFALIMFLACLGIILKISVFCFVYLFNKLPGVATCLAPCLDLQVWPSSITGSGKTLSLISRVPDTLGVSGYLLKHEDKPRH